MSLSTQHTTFEYENATYLCTPDTLKQTIAKYGVAIIPNVLSDVECDEFRDGFWEYLEAVTANTTMTKSNNINVEVSSAIVRNNKDTWVNFGYLYTNLERNIPNITVVNAKMSPSSVVPGPWYFGIHAPFTLDKRRIRRGLLKILVMWHTCVLLLVVWAQRPTWLKNARHIRNNALRRIGHTNKPYFQYYHARLEIK